MNDSVHEKELSLAPGNKAREIPFEPAILSVLRNSTDFAPCPGVEMYQLTSTLCQTLSLSYFRCPCVPSGIKYPVGKRRPREVCDVVCAQTTRKVGAWSGR